MLMLLPRFCASFLLQTFKTVINIWPHLKFFSPPFPAVLGWLRPCKYAAVTFATRIFYRDCD